MAKIMESQIFDFQNSAGARERGADCVGRIGEDSLTLSRHRINDRKRLGRELAIDIVTFLVTRMFHASDKDAISIEIFPPQQRDFLLPARREDREPDNSLHRNR